MRRRAQNPIRMAAVALLLAVVPVAVAQATKPAAAKEEVVRLEVSAAAAPDPALRYTFLTPIAEQVPGPAAPLYLNATSLLPEKVTVGGKERDFYDVLTECQDKPLAELKGGEVAKVLNRPTVIDLLWQGSKRTRADWGTTIREQGFEALLPYLNRIRLTAMFLCQHGRSRLAAGDVEGAVRDARIVFSLCNHLREEGVLVQTLVGAGAAQLGLTRLVEEVERQPGAPNLYWALANLPRPLYDMREAMGWERATVRVSITPLRGGRSPDQFGPGDWEAVTRDFVRMATAGPALGARSNGPVEMTALAVVFYPRAKQILVDAGTPAAAVDAMPAAQVLGSAMLRTNDYWADEMSKWAALPYWQAAPHLAGVDDALRAAHDRDPFNLGFALVGPLNRAYTTVALLDRHVAILQAVEAVRGYAAAHGGAVPPALDQVADMPVPMDPMSGKAFEYRTTGERGAEVWSPVAPVLRYVLTIRK